MFNQNLESPSFRDFTCLDDMLSTNGFTPKGALKKSYLDKLDKVVDNALQSQKNVRRVINKEKPLLVPATSASTTSQDHA